MISELERKIYRVSKDISLEKNLSFRPNEMTTLAFEAQICMSPLYPNNIFLLHKNMIFNAGTIEDTEYEVHKFDMRGKYIGKVDKKMLKPTFFSSLQEIKEIK